MLGARVEVVQQSPKSRNSMALCLIPWACAWTGFSQYTTVRGVAQNAREAMQTTAHATFEPDALDSSQMLVVTSSRARPTFSVVASCQLPALRAGSPAGEAIMSHTARDTTPSAVATSYARM